MQAEKKKTICIAVTPSLKAFGILGRARLFEVVQKVREVNATRRSNAPHHSFRGYSMSILQMRCLWMDSLSANSESFSQRTSNEDDT